MEVLASTAIQEEAHFSAEDIYKELISKDEDIGLATIYRVLTQFEAAGMVTKHHFENSKAVYEINSDEHHDHMVDVDTGKVMEFHDEEIRKTYKKKLQEKYGYTLVDHKLELYGIKKNPNNYESKNFY